MNSNSMHMITVLLVQYSQYVVVTVQIPASTNRNPLARLLSLVSVDQIWPMAPHSSAELCAASGTAGARGGAFPSRAVSRAARAHGPESVAERDCRVPISRATICLRSANETWDSAWEGLGWGCVRTDTSRRGRQRYVSLTRAGEEGFHICLRSASKRVRPGRMRARREGWYAPPAMRRKPPPRTPG